MNERELTTLRHPFLRDRPSVTGRNGTVVLLSSVYCKLKPSGLPSETWEPRKKSFAAAIFDRYRPYEVNLWII